jgi:NADH:ubiquinone oxidoreductase subunit 3 (subunit A)
VMLYWRFFSWYFSAFLACDVVLNVSTSLAKNAEKYQEKKRQYNITGQKCWKIFRKHMSVQDHKFSWYFSAFLASDVVLTFFFLIFFSIFGQWYCTDIWSCGGFIVHLGEHVTCNISPKSDFC